MRQNRARSMILRPKPKKKRTIWPSEIRLAKERRNRRNEPVIKVSVAPEIIADAARRANLKHPSLTAAFFGDPLPGYSALDLRDRS